MQPAARAPSLTIRPGELAELDRIAELIYGDPSDESVGIAGSRENARALGLALFECGVEHKPHDEFLVALRDVRVVGVLLARTRDVDAPLGARRSLRILRVLLRLYPPLALVELLRRTRLRAQLNFALPEDSYHVAELHVDPALRGQGIGGSLLAHAERDARSRGYRRMSLTAVTANPARRLYERNGFRVVQTREAPGYEALTGSRGRVLMEKRLAAVPALPGARRRVT